MLFTSHPEKALAIGKFTREMRRLKAIPVCVNSFKSKEVLIWVQLLSRNNNIVLCVTLFEKYHNTFCFPSKNFA